MALNNLERRQEEDTDGHDNVLPNKPNNDQVFWSETGI